MAGQRPTDQQRHLPSQDSRSRAHTIELDALMAQIAFYRREAQRLLGLAASSTFEDAKRQFLALAQQYETLAEHTAQRAERLGS